MFSYRLGSLLIIFLYFSAAQAEIFSDVSGKTELELSVYSDEGQFSDQDNNCLFVHSSF